MGSTVVLFGGNGYLGRELTRQWAEAVPDTHFWILSRSGRNSLKVPNCHNVAVDVTDEQAIRSILPDQIDYIVDLVGRPAKNIVDSQQVNDRPAQVMQQLAESYQVRAMGFIGGKLGSKEFLATKQRLIDQLRKSTIPLAVVAPTLLYGADRHDKLSRMVPVLQFLGLFSARIRPMKVEVAARELLNQLLEIGK